MHEPERGDQGEGLGQFAELEVVLEPGQATSEGIAAAHDLMARLGISEHQLVDRAYVDLLSDS